MVWVYYGRCGQENYFSLEDRELGLDHLFSTNLAGQQLANVVGLWLWNLELVHGVWAHGGLPDVDDKPRRRAIADDPIDDPGDVEALAVESSPLATSVDGADVEPSLAAFDWAGYFADKSGFHWDEELGCPVCATGEPLRPHRVCVPASGNLEVHFRTRRGPCQGCALRDQCTRSKNPRYRKGISVTIPLVDDNAPLPESGVVRRLRWRSAQPSAKPHQPFQPRAPVLIAQKLRHQFKKCCTTSRAQLDITRPPPEPEPPELYAMTAQQRQRRRRTWSQRIGWNRLDAGSKSTLTLLASPELQRYLEHTEKSGSSAVEAGMR